MTKQNKTYRGKIMESNKGVEYVEQMFLKIAEAIQPQLKHVSQSIRQKDLVFEEGEGKISKCLIQKRALKEDKLLYLHILQWMAESRELHRRLEHLYHDKTYKVMGWSFLRMAKNPYCVEGADRLLPQLIFGFMTRHPKTGEKLLKQIKEVFLKCYNDTLEKKMLAKLSEKGVPTWNGNLRQYMAGEC